MGEWEREYFSGVFCKELPEEKQQPLFYIHVS